jgi:hypothetical protein
MFLCPLLVQIWPNCGLWNFIDAAVHITETVTAAVFDLLQNVDDDQAAKLATIMSSIWKHHNLKFWSNRSESSTQILA